MSIFFYEPPAPRQPGPDGLWLFLAVLAGILTTILSARYHVVGGIAGGIVAGVLTWQLPAMHVRHAVLKTLHDVSASHAHDRFLRLAIQITTSPRRVRRHWHVLMQIAKRRPHPNASTLAALEATFAPGLTSDTVTQAHHVAWRILSAKSRIRANATATLQEYLRKEITSKTVLVLYGFSAVVCDALTTLQTKTDVIVLADQQYGGKSHREHERVLRRFREKARKPHIIPFAEAKQLLLGKHTVANLDGSAVNLGSRTTLVVLGCETYATDGSVLIPAQTEDVAPDTGTLLELLEALPAARRKKVHLIIAAETYKLRDALTAEDTAVTPPLAFSAATLPAMIAYVLFGMERFLPSDTVQLVRIDLRSGVRAIVDDAGIHHASDTAGLAEALRGWSRMLRVARGPDDLGFTGTCEAYILDLNGVLANDEHLHRAAFVELVHSQRGSLTHDEYTQACVGRTDREGIERLIELGRITGDPAALVAQKQRIYRGFAAGQAKPYPHAKELVQRLLQLRKRVYLVTSASLEEARQFVEQAGLSFAFDERNTYADVTSATRAAIYRQVIADTRLGPSAVVVVDDSPANLRLAQTLRLRTIGVQTTRPTEVRADQLVRDADDLYTMIKETPTY